jgi:ribose transport system substrate-binding protein
MINHIRVTARRRAVATLVILCLSGACQSPAAAANASSGSGSACALLAPTAAAAVPDLPDGLPCPAKGKAWKVGILHVGDCPYCSGLLAAYKEEAGLLGLQTTILDAQLKSDLQAQQLDQLIAQKPDIIIAVPVNTKALIPGLARAKAAGIPVVNATIKVDPAGEEYVVGYVGIDDTMAGKLSADLMIKAINGTGKIVVVAGQPGGSEVLRTKGFQDEMAAKATAVKVETVQYTDFTKENALAVTRSLLAKYPDLNGIWGEDDTIGTGIAQAVSDVGKTAQIQIVGMNGNKGGCTAIQKGQMYGTIVQQPYLDGAWSVIYAVDVLEGHQPAKFIALSQPEITKANIAEWLPKCW